MWYKVNGALEHSFFLHLANLDRICHFSHSTHIQILHSLTSSIKYEWILYANIFNIYFVKKWSVSCVCPEEGSCLEEGSMTVAVSFIRGPPVVYNQLHPRSMVAPHPTRGRTRRWFQGVYSKGSHECRHQRGIIFGNRASRYGLLRCSGSSCVVLADELVESHNVCLWTGRQP